MQSVTSVVERIKAKTGKLLALHESVLQSNSELKAEVNRLKNRIEELEEANRKLEEKNKILRLSKALSGDEEKNLALKLKINEMVREIDRCIAQLSK
ncbi:MAG: hypothetical protein Fur0041_16080 [Bacteroidia bacterium]